jgi:hypothetical protein
LSKTPTRGTPAVAILAVILFLIAALSPRANADPSVALWPSASDGTTAWIARESKLGQWAVLRLTGSPPGMKIDNAGWMPRPVIALGGDSRRCIVVLRREANWYAVREIDEPAVGPRGPVFGEPRALPPLPGDARPVLARVTGNITLARVAPEAAEGTTAATEQWLALVDGVWTPSIAPTDAASASTLAIGGDFYALARDGNDIVISMGAPNQTVLPATETARLKDIPRESAVFTLAGQIVGVWENQDGALWYASVSPLGLDGGRGPITRDGPLPGREAVTLGAVITSIFASVLVWVLVPVKWRGPISPPAGFSYAERARRAAATVADLLPGFLVGEAITRWLSWVPADLLGVWPALVALAVTVVTTGAAEALFGVTLGKFAMRCRTVMPDGSRPSRRRCIVRNAVKFLCPPLSLLSLLVPPWVWTNPASLGTVVVVEEEVEENRV